jgi:hypothetical protein
MLKKTSVSLSLLLLVGAFTMLVPSEIQAKGPLFPRPYAFAWDWGVAPFDSPFGYINFSVDPLSAEWGPLDGFYPWGTAWALGYNGWGDDPTVWLSNWLRYTRHQNDGSDSRVLNVALMRPMPTDRRLDDPSLVRSLNGTDQPGRTLRGVPHPRSASDRNSSQTRSTRSTSYNAREASGRTYGSGGGYSGQTSTQTSSTGSTPYGGASHSAPKNR